MDRSTGVLNRVRANVEKLTAPVRAVTNSFTAMSRAAGLLSKASGLSDLIGKPANMHGAATGLYRVADAASSVGDAAEKAFRRVSFLIAGAAGVAYLFKRQFIDTASTFENLKISLQGIFGGSLDKARDAMAFIKRMTIETPFEMAEIARSFRTMLGFGLDPMKGTLQAIVDQVAKLGGSGEDLTGIAMQLGQAFSKGRLQAQDANILVERGVPVWGLLARAIERVKGGQKVTIGQLREMSEKGQIGIKGINLLIEQMGIESQGASKRMMGTWTGLISNLKDKWELFKLRVMDTGAFQEVKRLIERILNKIDEWEKNGTLQRWADEIGATLLRAFKWLETNGPKILSDLVSWMQSIGNKAQWVAEMFGGWGNLITFGLAAYIAGPLVAAVFSLTAAVVSLGVAIGFTPVGWLLAALAAISMAAVGLMRNWGAIKAFFVDLWDGVKEAFVGFIDFLATKSLSGLSDWFDGIVKIAKAGIKALLVVLTPFGLGPRLTRFLFGVRSEGGAYSGGDPLFGRGASTPAPPASSPAAPRFQFGPLADLLTAARPRVGPLMFAPQPPTQGPQRPALGAGSAVSPSTERPAFGADRAAPARPGGAPAATPPQDTTARVVVDFRGTPRGTRVTADPASTAPLSLNVGYAMADGF